MSPLDQHTAGLEFLSADYRSAERFREDLAAARAAAPGPLGVTIDVGGGYADDPQRFQAYAQRLAGAPVRLGSPRFGDKSVEAKVAALLDHPVAVVSFKSGLPHRRVVDALHAAGSQVWMTVSSPKEARRAAARGADAVLRA